MIVVVGEKLNRKGLMEVVVDAAVVQSNSVDTIASKVCTLYQCRLFDS